MEKIAIDHSKDSLNEALGITEERKNELAEQVSEAMEKAQKESGGKGLSTSQQVEIILDTAENINEAVPMLMTLGVYQYKLREL